MAPKPSTYLPPVVVIPLRLLGNDASSEPQVSVDVQGPQSLLVPEGDTDRLQSLPFTANEREDRGVSTHIQSPQESRPAGIKCLGGGGRSGPGEETHHPHQFQGRKLEF